VLRKPPHSMEQLWEMQSSDNTSLGIVKPQEIKGFICKPDTAEWKDKWKADIAQGRLFGPERKPLDKIPWKFQYRFTCNDLRCNGHMMMIEDWEVGALYLNELRRLGDPDRAVESVRYKFFDVLCSPTRDTHFFVGTVRKHPKSWVILGVFCPPKEPRRRRPRKLTTGSLFE
jgi:hypothetical protein